MGPRIAILDYGGQYVQNIRRAFREMAIVADILPPDSKYHDIKDCDGIVLSGGPYSVYETSAPSADPEMLTGSTPVIGLCYGHQLIAHLLGGGVSGGRAGEYGFSEIEVKTKSPLFEGIDSPQIAWMSHGDEVVELPEGFESLASTQGCPNAAMAHRDLPLYGLQFHPEVSHTPKGWQMLVNFATRICGLEVGAWDPKSYIQAKQREIRAEVGDGCAMVAVSGGVDSTVAAALAQRALGNHLVTVHVDHGFMRQGESQSVVEELRPLGLDPILVEAADEFNAALAGVVDGDTKRKAVGKLFIETFERIASEKGVTHLIQGTIAPDAIESSRGMASEGKGSEHGGMIKLHHNVGGLPKEMWIRVLEPIRDLFKYQVRILGRELGVPDSLLERQPFPGPGLSVRISGAVEPQVVEVLRRSTVLIEEALKPYRPAQYFVYLIDQGIERDFSAEQICSQFLGESYEAEAWTHEAVAVGVKGDERALGKILSLQLCPDGSPAWEEVKWLDILRLQSALTGRLRNVCRVIVKLSESHEGGLAAVIRAVDTRDFMTAMPTEISFNWLCRVGRKLIEIPEIGSAFYEITTKPSSTIELE